MNSYSKKKINWSKIINGLTLSRIIIGFPLILALASRMYELSIILIVLGGLTDFLDGYLARKLNFKSKFGAKLDPLADKVLLIGPLIWIAHENIVPIWSVWILISRELIVTGWRSNLQSGGPASFQGKCKTVLQFTSIILLLWPEKWFFIIDIIIINRLGFIGFWISFILALISGFKYLINQKESHHD